MSTGGRRIYRLYVSDGSQGWSTLTAARNPKSAERIARIVEERKWGKPIVAVWDVTEDRGHYSACVVDGFERMQAQYGAPRLEVTNV